MQDMQTGPGAADLPARLAALMERERRTRFAGGKLGPLWAYLTPLGWILLVVLAFDWLGRSVPIAAPMPIFVASGILPYAMFRQVVASLMRSVIANRHLVYLRPVDSTEILLASALLELLNMVVIAVLIFGLLWLWLAPDAPADLLTAAWGMALAWGLGTGVGRLAAALGQVSDTAYRAIPLALRPMFWISGIFFTATELGGAAQALLWWNPLLHAVEILREGLFPAYVSPIADSGFPLAVALGFHLAAIVLERRTRTGHLARHGV